MQIITVSQLNMYLKAVLEEDRNLSSIYISGEITNFKNYYRSGHLYFSLKDEKAQLKCVMFAFSAQRLKFMPQDGMRVICCGRVSIYERDGVYQLYVDDMQPDGVGAMTVAFEQLKEKLRQKGYFDESHKKPVPKRPQKIGVVTSPAGAALHDILTVTARRFPLAEIVLSPTAVQGEDAPRQIAAALDRLDRRSDIDVIIVGRGGGSLEDLNAFNAEIVADAVYRCHVPVVSAVGHETDFTICDFTADMRAPTPSAAAELVTVDRQSELAAVEGARLTMQRLLYAQIDAEMQRVDTLSEKEVLRDFQGVLQSGQEKIAEKKQRLQQAYQLLLENRGSRFSALCRQLDALSPLAVLARGYAIVSSGDAEKTHLQSVHGVQPGANVAVRLQDGEMKCQVKEVLCNGKTEL